MSHPYAPVPRPHENSGTHIALAWVTAVLTGLYMLPWAIAATRHKENTAMIALLNLFLGWSGVGWIVSLVLACLSDPVRNVAPSYGTFGYTPPPPPAGASYQVAPRALEPAPEFPAYQPPPSPFQGAQPIYQAQPVHQAPPPQHQALPGRAAPLFDEPVSSAPYAFGMNSNDPWSTYPAVSQEAPTVEGTVEDGRRR